MGGWIILRWILERWDGVMWTGLVWLRIGSGGELMIPTRNKENEAIAKGKENIRFLQHNKLYTW
jgi:hypothetical protein